MSVYKEAIENYFDEIDSDPEYLTESEIEGYELALRFFNVRMEANLKQYNDNVERAYDFYSTKNMLEQFNLYANELYLLDKSPVSSHEKIVSKTMRNVHNHLQLVVNELGDL